MDPRPYSQCAQCSALALACAACAPGPPACPRVKWQACGVAACQRQGYSLTAQDSVDLMQTVQTSMSMLLLQAVEVGLSAACQSGQQKAVQAASRHCSAASCSIPVRAANMKRLNKGIAVQLSMQLRRAARLNAGCLPKFS